MIRDITLWPLILYNSEWTIPDHFLLDVWGKMLDAGLDKIVFYDGTVKTGLEWLQYVKSPGQFFVFGVSEEKKEFLGMGWLSNIRNRTAEAHFAFFNKYIPGAGEKLIEYFGKILNLKVIYGCTPESYKTVLKLLKKWGFKSLRGKIPDYCDMIYKNTREGAVISYRKMEEADVQA